jgi:hypothetical protein
MDTFDDNSFPVVNLSNDGWSTDDEATATCFCRAVQLVLVSAIMFKALCKIVSSTCVRYNFDSGF